MRNFKTFDEVRSATDEELLRMIKIDLAKKFAKEEYNEEYIDEKVEFVSSLSLVILPIVLVLVLYAIGWLEIFLQSDIILWFLLSCVIVLTSFHYMLKILITEFFSFTRMFVLKKQNRLYRHYRRELGEE